MTSKAPPAQGHGAKALVCTTLLAVALFNLLPATATASANDRDSTFIPGLSPYTRLGEGGSVSLQTFFTGTEYHGQVAPLTGLTFRLPEGFGFHLSGFPTCNKAEIEQYGPIKCPPGSEAGEVGSMRAIVYFPEAKEEEAEVRTYFGPGDVLLFYVDGHTPVSLEDLFEGHLVSDIDTPPYGQDLVIEEIPFMQQSPTSPYVSITALTLNIGTTEEVNGSEVSSLTLPSTCNGSTTWAAEASFESEREVVGGSAFEAGCPPAGAREATTTALTVSSVAPYENEPVTYTATVTPLHDGAVPTGTVTFPGTGCGVLSLVAGTTSATATCQESFPDPEVYSENYDIGATYEGSETDRGSSSPGETIHVQAGKAPVKQEVPPPHHEETVSTGSGGTSSAGSSTGSTTTPVATISSAQLMASLKQQLVSVGKTASTGSLLKYGGLMLPFTALEAGTLSVQWFYKPQGAKAATVSKIKPMLVATGTVRFAAAGAGKLMLRLTAVGRKLLKQSKRVRLEAKGTFVGSGQPVTITLLIQR